MLTEILNFIIKLDKGLFLFINLKLQNGFFDFLMPILTEFKYWRIPFFLCVVALLVFGNKKTRISGILLLIILGITDATVNMWLKPWIGRVKPCNVFPDVHLLAGCSHSGSFPSSHAANIFGAGTILTCFYRRLWVLWLIIAVSVSFSRIYVGVHYPLDVLAGAFYGILWGVLILAIVKYIFRSETFLKPQKS
jgi:undecaprenyl-diphosphatase